MSCKLLVDNTVYWGICWGFVGIMERKMKTTLKWCIHWGYIIGIMDSCAGCRYSEDHGDLVSRLIMKKKMQTSIVLSVQGLGTWTLRK